MLSFYLVMFVLPVALVALVFGLARRDGGAAEGR
jgi:hypothetical protein